MSICLSVHVFLSVHLPISHLCSSLSVKTQIPNTLMPRIPCLDIFPVLNNVNIPVMPSCQVSVCPSVNHHIDRHLLFSGAKYYLNIDRCANGGIRPVASTLDGLPMVRGAEIIAVNHNCTRVYYHSDKWEPYDSGRDIACTTDEEEYGE